MSPRVIPAINRSSGNDNVDAEEVPTFLIAGHETTRYPQFPCRTRASTHTWSLARLSFGASMLYAATPECMPN